MNKNRFDIIVVGAGHAGIEAALSAAKMGANVLIFVIKIESIGRMSCNPSVGGPAKGHLAREIDALGGEIGKSSDLSGIQFRMLNKKKGPAVWAPRSQNDRTKYTIIMRQSLENQTGLNIKESIIDEIILSKNRKQVIGVRSNLGEEYFAPKVILANGTFLRGKVHIGNVSYSSGRAGEPAAEKLSLSLLESGLNLARFKTGTPPRIDLRTIDMNKVEEQPGDEDPQGFSYYRDIALKNDVSCYLTFTNPVTHQIINSNLDKSSLYGGYISGIGPRYCPSIEDKVVKFSKKEHHQVFIEPEGEKTFEAYVNGVSNSLPPEIQKRMLHSIEGLKESIIIRYGYAIEYDYIIPDEIKPTMETKKIEGLYLAGQINGTSGYEEAAAQGIAAGINSVLSLEKKDPIIFDRSQSYLGVLLDDLVTKGTTEPYRLFTSRAEYRLYLRQDNADERMMPLGYKLGLVEDVRWRKFRKMMEIHNREMEFLKNNNSLKTSDIKEPTRLINILKRPEITFNDLQKFGYKIPLDVTEDIKSRISLEIKYEGYLKRQLAEIEKFEKMEHNKMPENLDYMKINSIAYEARERLNKIKPVSLGQAARISGVNHTDITALMIYLKKVQDSRVQRFRGSEVQGKKETEKKMK
ncbi:MAG TPA: tRNA uridine-5-carboxymethylaminomethyl(34) synthesis enzyme MnmG [Candidatus Cloacimonetes bacterium]|nr:tRNA uridine-5-carboxymethylaminomethyl(34) synthesis enzyme MnmG [Candidatus Cloacimonadota bacterium]